MWLRTTLIVLVVLGALGFGLRMFIMDFHPVFLMIVFATISFIGYLEDDNVNRKETRLGLSLGLSFYLPYVLMDVISQVDWMQPLYIVFYYVLPAIIFLTFQAVLYQFNLTNR